MQLESSWCLLLLLALWAARVPVEALRGEDYVDLWGFGPELTRALADGVV